MADFQHTTRRALLGGASALGAGWAGAAVASPNRSTFANLDARLTELIARFDRAEMEAQEIFRRIYPSGREAVFAAFGEPKSDFYPRLQVYEQETGYDAACEAMDEIAESIFALNKQIIAMPSNSPDALSLKARACLWDSPPRVLEREGCLLVATLLAQLADPDRFCSRPNGIKI
jgi:hypothetical protein